MLKNSHLFESIPEAFIKGAFLDRIHLYNPGWEVRVLKKSSFTAGFGFITDYLAELLHDLRKQDYSPIIQEYVKFDSTLTERDHTAIRKTFSGMMKLIYPDKKITQSELLELIDFAVEGRKRVKDQLYIIDETFCAERACFDYQLLSTGEEIHVETLERLNFPQLSMKEGFEKPADSNANEEDKKIISENQTILKRLSIIPKSIKNLTVRENQTGISYEYLFFEYLKGATKITIEDPYIRYPYQVRNLIEFISLIIKLNDSDNFIKLHLITWNTEERTPDSIDAFDEIRNSMSDSGIEFTYEFKDFHDRKIITNTGWEIVLGRGLDIFEPRKGYSIEDYIQEKRRCKDFTVTYIPKELSN